MSESANVRRSRRVVKPRRDNDSIDPDTSFRKVAYLEALEIENFDGAEGKSEKEQHMAFNLFSELVEPAWSDDDGSFEDCPGLSSSRENKSGSSQASTAKK